MGLEQRVFTKLGTSSECNQTCQEHVKKRKVSAGEAFFHLRRHALESYAPCLEAIYF